MFTIIIPTHDRPLLLQRTLQSLIAQTYQDFKVIIVSDSAGYMPPFQELLALQGRYVYVIRSNGNSGPAESRNMGLDLVDSEFVVFLDDDDTFEPNHLQQLAAQIGVGKPELLFCDFQVQHEDRTSHPPQALSREPISIASVTADSVYILNRIPNSCLVYRSDVVKSVRFNTDMIIYEDWDFLLACLKGRALRHVAVNSVVIHKSRATAPENLRRGNTRDDLLAEVTVFLYNKHAAPNEATRQGRHALLASAGVPATLYVP